MTHDILMNVAGVIVGLILYAGSLVFWPLHRLLRKRRGSRAYRGLFFTFLAHLCAIAAWTAVEVAVTFRRPGDDWLHCLIVYVFLNAGFLVAYILVWLVGRRKERAALPRFD